MEEKSMCSQNMNNVEAKLDRVERELWDLLLKAEGVCPALEGEEPINEGMFTVEENPHIRLPYPWNPAHPQAETFFAQQESEFNLDDWSAEEIGSRSQAFFAQVNQLWTNASLKTSLTARFAHRVPQTILATIAERAQQVLATSALKAEQLVQCVQEILPNLAEDDLYSQARLFVPARSQSDSMLDRVRTVSWSELSDLEKARLSLAVARSAYDDMKQQQSESSEA